MTDDELSEYMGRQARKQARAGLAARGYCECGAAATLLLRSMRWACTGCGRKWAAHAEPEPEPAPAPAEPDGEEWDDYGEGDDPNGCAECGRSYGPHYGPCEHDDGAPPRGRERTDARPPVSLWG